MIIATTTWKISPLPTDTPLSAYPACTHWVISDCATPASAPVKEGTRAATIVHSQPPARRVNIVWVSSVICDRASKSSQAVSFLRPSTLAVAKRAANNRDRMRTSATSGPIFSLYLSIVLLVILCSISDKAHAKRE